MFLYQIVHFSGWQGAGAHPSMPCGWRWEVTSLSEGTRITRLGDFCLSNVTFSSVGSV